VVFSDLARAQLSFLEDRGVLDLEARLVHALRAGPAPHAYRRIRIRRDGTRRIAVKEWRADFEVSGQVVRVLHLDSGYPARALRTSAPELDTHRAFVVRFTNTNQVE
jgi:hypothetical protein